MLIQVGGRKQLLILHKLSKTKGKKLSQFTSQGHYYPDTKTEQ